MISLFHDSSQDKHRIGAIGLETSNTETTSYHFYSVYINIPQLFAEIPLCERVDISNLDSTLVDSGSGISSTGMPPTATRDTYVVLAAFGGRLTRIDLKYDRKPLGQYVY